MSVSQEVMPPESRLSRFRQTLAPYRDRRMLVVFLLGIASGFPWVITGSAMSAWLSEAGLTRSAIGYFGAIFAVYAVNFLWSPLVDRLRLPGLTRILGQRRSWILVNQVIMLCACVAISYTNPSVSLLWTSLLALSIALASATQDIAIDAYRIERIGQDQPAKISAAAAMATSGWWTGFAGIGALPFFLADLPGWSWSQIYLLLAGVIALCILVVLVIKEPENHRQNTQDEKERQYLNALQQNRQSVPRLFVLVAAMLGLAIWSATGSPGLSELVDDIPLYPLWIILLEIGLFSLIIGQLRLLHQHSQGQSSELLHQVRTSTRVLAWTLVTVVEPIAEFFRRNGVKFACQVLLFIFLFKIGEAFLGRMSIVFYKEIGFTNSEIGTYSKLITWWATILFSILGSLVNVRYGIVRGLMIGGIAMSASNLLFAVLAFVGPNTNFLAFAVVVDGFTSAWSTVAFVSFLSLMCNQAFTATQYALMASLGTLGRTLLASYSGAMVDWLNGNWALFFVLTTLMVLPSLVLLYSLRHKISALKAVDDAGN